MQLTDRLYAYIWQGSGNNCNTYLFAGAKNVLIDPGHISNEYRENCLEVLLQSMRADGFTPGKIDLILCTHSHPDHCEAGSFFQEKHGISVAMHKKEEAHMERLADLYDQMTGKRPELPSVDIYLQEGDLEVGMEEKDIIKVYLTPGHSPGSLSFYFPTEKALVTGDAVFQGSIGRTDLSGGSLEVLGESVDKLSNIEDVQWLLPGHMQLVRGQEAIKRNYDMIKMIFF